ncbi:hypothetical protein REPUB_Repub15cG0050600 [Reevesia pubescens]
MKEAEKLLLEVESMKAKQSTGDHSSKQQNVYCRSMKDDDDTDEHLAQRIIHNKQYGVSGQADNEYDYVDVPSRKSRKKGGGNDQVFGNNNLTQQEHCLFWFENLNRPKHLVVAIANFTYLMLPQWQPVVLGHCCILPMQVYSLSMVLSSLALVL